MNTETKLELLKIVQQFTDLNNSLLQIAAKLPEDENKESLVGILDAARRIATANAKIMDSTK